MGIEETVAVNARRFGGRRNVVIRPSDIAKRRGTRSPIEAVAILSNRPRVGYGAGEFFWRGEV